MNSRQKVENLLKINCGFTNISFVRHLHGGDINDVYLIHADGKDWVVKENDALRFPLMLEKEERALQYLHKNSPAYYPQPLCSFTVDNRQFLVMEYVEKGLNNSKGQVLLGKQLAQQHKVNEDYFGWEEDNYIGSLVQINTKTDNWLEFFIEHRLLFQAKMAFDKQLLTRTDLQRFERMFQRLNELIPEESPALLHGDLWGGNYFIAENDKPFLYDPAVYFGHREIDIGMTQLFGGFSADFYRAYNEEHPLEKGWEDRVPICQLYPNLVHVNLFGSGYVGSVRRVIDKF